MQSKCKISNWKCIYLVVLTDPNKTPFIGEFQLVKSISCTTCYEVFFVLGVEDHLILYNKNKIFNTIYKNNTIFNKINNSINVLESAAK